MGGFDISYAGAVGAGLLSFLSPCVLPLVPPYLAYLGGVSIDHFTGEGKVEASLMQRVLLASLLFVLGFTTVFVMLGATASALNNFIIDYLDVLGKIAGAVIIVFGLHFMGLFRIGFLNMEARINVGSKPAGAIGAYVMGLAFAFGWTPCVGPFMAAVLTVAAGEESIWSGISLLATYSLGLGIPFVGAALFARPFMRFHGRFRRHMHKVELAAGGLLVAMGVLLMLGTFDVIAYWILETVPALGRLG